MTSNLSVTDAKTIIKEVGRLYGPGGGNIDRVADQIAVDANDAIREALPGAPEELANVIEEVVRLAYHAAAADIARANCRNLATAITPSEPLWEPHRLLPESVIGLLFR